MRTAPARRPGHLAALWLVPLVLHAADACAWGLYTHVYFAQLLLWAVPLADPRFRRALRRFPELVLAGACLPDVSLFGRFVGAHALRSTHRWSAAHRLLHGCTDEAERAIALGYAGHLLTDIVAHNYFVPAHEAMWFQAPLVSHAASEWAMDAHLAPQLFAAPAGLLERHGGALLAFAAQRFDARPTLLERALRCLTHGERLLRSSHLPHLVYAAARAGDADTPGRFDEYVRETSGRLAQLDRLIAGDEPAWQPEPAAATPQRPHAVAFAPFQATLLPADFFRQAPPPQR